MKSSLLLIAVYGLCSVGLAQDLASISGKILSSNGPVPGATVQLIGTERGEVANADGEFFISNIDAGEVTLEFRSIGYKLLRKTVTAAPGANEIQVTLKENSLGLNEVVVTGTMAPTFVKSSPVKVRVVTSKYFNTFTPAAASSVMDGVKLVNGVQEVVACGVCFTNSISINGLPGPYTAVLMDGAPIYGSLASVYGLNGIPSMIIEQFEVIKGPGSTLYGSEAMAGVINIITKDPATQPKLSVDLMGTTHKESFGNLSVAPVIGRSKGFIGLNYAYINDFDDQNHDGFGDMINLDRYAVFTKWNIFRPSQRKFTVAAKYYYEDRRNGLKEFLKDRNYKTLRGSSQIYGESIYTKRMEVFGTYDLPVGSGLRIDYSLSHHAQDSYYGKDYYEAKQQIAFANLIWDQQLGNHKLLTGFTTRYQFYDDNTVATASAMKDNHPEHQYIPGIFVQDEWKTSGRFTILGGGRLDHYTAHGFIFSPRLSLKYKPAEWTTYRANFGTGFRIVNLFAEDHAFITGQRTVEIVSTLKPERSVNGTLNLTHVYNLGNSQGTLDIDAYYTYFTNKIIPDYSDPEKIIYDNSESRAVTRGIGANLTHEFPFDLAVNLGLTVQKATHTSQKGQGDEEAKAIEFAPDWSGIITANYTWKKAKTTLAYTFRVTGPMALPQVYDLGPNGLPLPYSRPTRSEPFALHNIQISKDFANSWTLYGGVQNIFNYIQPFSPLTGHNDPNNPPGFSPFFDTAYAYSPIHGQELYLGVRWNMERKAD